MSVEPARLQAFLAARPQLKYTGNQKSYIFICPRCSKNLLYVRKSDGRFVCWRCTADDSDHPFQGAPEYAFSEILGESIYAIQAVLYETPPMGEGVLKGLNRDEEEDVEVVVPSCRAWPLNFYPLDHKFSARGVEYLEGRGVPFEVAHQYGIRFAPSLRSVVFPVYLEFGLVGWQTRLVVENEYEDPVTGSIESTNKSTTALGFNSKSCWMFQERLKGSNHACLVEGPIDALKLHLVGGNVCSMGKLISKTQVDIILDSGISNVYLGLDKDASKVTRRLVKAFMENGINCYRLQAPKPYKDLGAMAMEEVAGLFKTAPELNLTDLFFSSM